MVIKFFLIVLCFIGNLCALEHQFAEIDLGTKDPDSASDQVLPTEIKHHILNHMHRADFPHADVVSAGHHIYTARQDLLRKKQLRLRGGDTQVIREVLYNDQGTRFLKIFRKRKERQTTIDDLGKIMQCELHLVISPNKSHRVAIISKNNDGKQFDVQGLSINDDATSTVSWSADGKRFLIAPRGAGVAVFDNAAQPLVTIADPKTIFAGFTDTGDIAVVSGEQCSLGINFMNLRGNKIAHVPMPQKHMKNIKGIGISADGAHIDLFERRWRECDLLTSHIAPHPLWQPEAKMLWLILYACKKEDAPLNFQMIAHRNPNLSVQALEGALTRCPKYLQKHMVQHFDIRKSSVELQRYYDASAIDFVME